MLNKISNIKIKISTIYKSHNLSIMDKSRLIFNTTFRKMIKNKIKYNQINIQNQI